MERWFLILVSISISFFLKIVFNNFLTSKKLPPGPLTFPFIGNLLWLRLSHFKVEPILRSLHAKFGPMVTLRIGTRTAIFVADRTLAHEALVQNSAVYADRPPSGTARRIINSNQHNISCSFFGPTWRLLRRNLTAEILHPSRVKSYTRTDTTSAALQWIIANLVKYQQIQEKLFVEIKGVVQDGDESIKEEELQNKLYLKALILEGAKEAPASPFRVAACSIV
ncbi:hypothetical protein OIU84_029564 [Salix udensis]|uniref:Cytochrome P450 n=1 Tax=Salix udensis TaxID=889485 RepID=A0AAD6K9J3_9ROSI|nr:hypothetical protein OIU84_029564 [Salix udensis]